MNPTLIIFLLVAAAAVLLMSELVLPTHGLLAAMGLFCLALALGECFLVNRWIGLIVLICGVICAPPGIAGAMSMWRRSPIGRRIILRTTNTQRQINFPLIGEIGIARSDLRPGGECEFGQLRIRSTSELGEIPKGAAVQIVSIDHGLAKVRNVETNLESKGMQ